MTLSDLMLKLEKFIASLTLDELYLLRGLVFEDAGAAMLINKIDAMIVYMENKKYATHDEFKKLMKESW